MVYDDPSGYASTSTGKACPPQGKISESVDESGSSSKIANKFPNEAMPSDGKVFDYHIENGRIKGIDGRNNVDFVITTDNNLIIGNRHHYLGNGQDVLAAG